MLVPTTLLALVVSIIPLVAADWPSCDPSCKACGLYCNEGCAAPLVLSECNKCLYCRRESSSCGFVQIGGSDDQPDPAYCAQCQESCHCYIDAKCYDNTTITTTASSTPTPSAAVLH